MKFGLPNVNLLNKEKKKIGSLDVSEVSIQNKENIELSEKKSSIRSRKRNFQELIHLRTTVNVTALESLRGCKKTIQFNRYTVCHNCTSAKKRCLRKFKDVNSESNVDTDTKSNKAQCNVCEGCKKILKPDQVSFTVPMGVSTGKELVINGRGDNDLEGDVGDLIVFFKVEPHPQFHRKGNHALVRVILPYSSYMLGCSVSVPTLYNGNFCLDLPPFRFPHGTVMNLSQIGFYDPDTQKFGDMRLVFVYDSPLDPKEFALLQILQSSFTI
eukprot:TRINITY_DN9009_c0_g1_i1.p1 TRINITY_DN9009_c0_g1~~TRINITY_DN9009_c0_g1_i1.p1  ORF type:complete len:270 (+),score=43.53 TRINITY_DN9009_c0_g1_i1:145-954(+)